MEALTWVRSRFADAGRFFHELADSSVDTPVIGNWCAVRFYDVAYRFYRVSIELIDVEEWVDDTRSRVLNFLTWDQIKTNVRGEWSWIPDPVANLWGGFRERILGDWSWIPDPVANLWGGFRDRILADWSWIPDPVANLWGGFYDRILENLPWASDPVNALWGGYYDRIVETWGWLNTIDDKIREIAWGYVQDHILGFLVDRAADLAGVGYRVLSYVWNLEWDDEEKEAKS